MSNLFKNSKITITILLLLVAIIIQQSLNYKKTKSFIKNQAQAELIKSSISFVELTDGTGLVGNSLNNFALFVDLNDGYVSQVIRQKGNYYQPEIAQTLKRIIKPDDIVLHLGGHIGSFEPLIGNLVGKNGKVFTFEANPQSYKVLKKNVTLHNLEDIITTYNKGVWSKNTIQQFCHSNLNSGGSAVSPNKQLENPNCFDIELVKLDDILKNQIDHVDVIFMDIEGSEIHAMEGFSEILSKSPNAIILMEWSKHSLESRGSDVKSFWEKQLADSKRVFKIAPEADVVYYKELSSLNEILEQTHCDLIILPKSINPTQLLKFTH